MNQTVHLDLDGAWPADVLGLPRLDVRRWGPSLRYIARRADVEKFWRELEGKLPPFVLYGSGDFHHLAGMLIRRVASRSFTLVSFDNHPDWDIRPPYWSCGGWAARALRNAPVEKVSVWGCGNFELHFPTRLWADRRALRERRLDIHAWAERQPASVRKRFSCMTRETWRGRFETFARSVEGRDVYVTVDMDCLRVEEAATNWENGLFTADDVAWAISKLRSSGHLVGADVCGAYSPPEYARWGQRFAGKWDRPKLESAGVEHAREVNLQSLRIIWSALV